MPYSNHCSPPGCHLIDPGLLQRFNSNTSHFPLIFQQVCVSPLSTIVSISSGQILLLGSRFKTPPSPDMINWLDPSLKRQHSSSEVSSRSRQGSASSQRSQRSLSQTSLSSAVRDSSHSVERQSKFITITRLMSVCVVSPKRGLLIFFL